MTSENGRIRLGVMSTEFVRPALAETLDAIAGNRFGTVQLHVGSAVPEKVDVMTSLMGGLDAVGMFLNEELCSQIREQLSARDLELGAVDGTFNMINPDTAARRTGIDHLCRLIEFCNVLDTSVVTLCAGSRDPIMWLRHDENATDAAWSDLVDTLR